MIIISITEFEMSVDSFNDPATLSNQKAVGMLILRLILLEPGTIQSHPDMGVGLISKYRYSQVGTGADTTLKSDIDAQITKYLPSLVGVKSTVTEQDKAFIIGLQISNDIYGISIDKETLEANITYKSLSDLSSNS